MHGLRPGLISASLLSSCLCLAQSKSSIVEQLPSADSVMNRVAVN